MSTLNELHALGQAVWLDSISRQLIATGELAQRVVAGLRGLTSNPAIFEKAIAQTGDYAAAISRYARQNLDAKAIFEQLAIADIRDSADILKPVYDASQGADGYVSLEVSPTLANDTEGTLQEARRLWREVQRPNLMIKVPGTSAGVPAIRQLISDGINVNVTLLFARSAYDRVAEAWLQGMEALSAKGGDVSRVASVASFFVSRIDSAVDALIDKVGVAGVEKSADKLRGKAAIANAKLAYQSYRERMAGARWQTLAAKGAHPQRLLWASTSSKNPAYRDVIYVEELIGPDTVNTLPPATLDAFLDHGVSRQTLASGVDEARRDLLALAALGISLDAVTDRLLEDGIRQFADSFSTLLAVIARQAQAA
jgi:transaldolase